MLQSDLEIVLAVKCKILLCDCRVAMKSSRSHSIPGDCSLEVKCQGFLEKQGRLIGSFMGKKYWCVLDSHRLSYYKHADKVCPQ